MNAFNEIWDGLSRTGRLAVSAALAVAVLATCATSYWLYRPDYQILFSDLAARDSAAMVAELDKMKVPYRLDQGGTAILVPAEQVYKTRLQLVGKDIPLQGAVGFELFNNSDMGMTDFAQKINYQRALQGELTRTIQSLAEVQAVRVHLSLPERGLLRGTSEAGKASIVLTLRPTRTLMREQVRGIQRLVAASVPEVKPERVVVVDQRGVALAGGEAEDDGAREASAGGKKEMEEYLARKAVAVLDQAFGAGKGVVKVDVVLNQEHTRVTTESVLPSNASSARPSGVVIREQESGPADTGNGSDRSSSRASLTREVQYQAGRRVEQIVSGPGSITRLNVAVIVQEKFDAAQSERIRDLVAMAVGLNRARGDGIAVYSVDQLGAGSSLPAAGADAPPQTDGLRPAPATDRKFESSETGIAAAVLMLMALAAAAVIAVMHARGRSARLAGEPVPLTEAQRLSMLADLRRWAETPEHPEVQA